MGEGSFLSPEAIASNDLYRIKANAQLEHSISSLGLNAKESVSLTCGRLFR